MRITTGHYEIELQALDKNSNQKAPNNNDTIQYLTELSILLHEAAKWQFKKGNKLTAEYTKECANDITAALHETGAL